MADAATTINVSVHASVVPSPLGITQVTRIEIPNDETTGQIAYHYLQHELKRIRGLGPIVVFAIGVMTEVSEEKIMELRKSNPDLAAACEQFRAAEENDRGSDNEGAVILSIDNRRDRSGRPS